MKIPVLSDKIEFGPSITEQRSKTNAEGFGTYESVKIESERNRRIPI